jgi:hypothetical protein
MALPVFVAAGTYVRPTSTAVTPGVPAGAAANHIALVFIYKENVAAVTPPAGFTSVTNSPIATTSQVSQLHIFWKRLTGADSGSYSFSWTGSCYAESQAINFSGCVTTGDPTEIDNAATSGSTLVSTTPAVSGTTLDIDRLLVWSASNFNGGAQVTVPASPIAFTRRDGGGTSSCIGVGSAGKATAGATGSITGSYSISAVETAFLVALSSVAPSAPAALYVPRRRGPNYRR